MSRFNALVNTTIARLADGPFLKRQELNRRYLRSLEPDRLLHNFRTNAGLASCAEPYGGWEAPDHGLRGHFVGHFLAACAFADRAQNDEQLQGSVRYMVRELATCQNALGGGYLSAFPETDLDEIETRFEGAWASYYVLHKILTGLIAVHRQYEDLEALSMAVRLVAYVKGRFDRLSETQLEGMLRTQGPNPTNETGGWSEALQNLYDHTGDPDHLRFAELFDRDWFFDPLSRRVDELTGLHCNTHIPMVLGAARRFERSGDVRYRDASVFFWEQTALARSYVNGGSSGPRPDGSEKSKGGEHWPIAHKLADTLTPKINESCVTHDMLRLTDTLFRWSAEPRYAEFYERALFSSVLCMQKPDELGCYLYDHPLGEHSRKVYGSAEESFWCCYGSSVEAFARLSEGLYYTDSESLWINQFISSECSWPEKGVRVSQETKFPNKDSTRLVFHCDLPVALTVRIRIPTWVAAPVQVSLNEKILNMRADPGTFAVIDRTWQEGDALDLHFPMTMRLEPMPDDRRVVAFLYGPLVLAALTDENLSLGVDEANALCTAKAAPPFQVRLKNGTKVNLSPLNEVTKEPFGVYFRLQDGLL